MAGGHNPFMPPGSSLPATMPGASPAGPVGQSNSLGPGGLPAGPIGMPGGGRTPPQTAGVAPAGGPPTPPGGGGVDPGEGPPSMERAGRMLKAQLDQGMKAQGVLDHLRTELDQLMDMGDMVRPEQVVEAAGRLVGHGIGATQLAAIMSDMPAVGGEGLASWIRMHNVTVTNAEQQLMQENNLVRHQLGMAGMHMLVQQHVDSRLQMHAQNAQAMAAQGIPAGASNELAPPTTPGGADDMGGGDAS